jgi:hypothetical protein
MTSARDRLSVPALSVQSLAVQRIRRQSIRADLPDDMAEHRLSTGTPARQSHQYRAI